MKYNVFWTQTAQNDLSSIYNYLLLHESENIALDVFERIKKKTLSLSTFPTRGRQIPELSFQNIEGYRELIDSPWRIIYKISEQNVYIVSVIDGRRSFENTLLGRILNT
jgi:toxin ParE1/3/4